MISNRIVLIIVGVIVLVMGILGLVPDLDMASEPEWHAALKVIVGLIAIGYGYMNQEK